jgi:ATP-binding cassette subfamily F protein uup
LIAQLMLQPADVLLLDEPTNDLDIPTLEILEETLGEYRGALVLVTHDRYMLDRVSTIVLGFDGLGQIAAFADYSQWETWQREQVSKEKAISAPMTLREKPAASRKKLSYKEARELETIEQRIAEAEERLRISRETLEDPAIASDGPRLLAASAQIAEAQNEVDQLYARWTELEGIKGR